MSNASWQSYTKANVYLRKRHVGTLERVVEESLFRFRYETSYVSDPLAIAVARTFPVRSEPFDAAELHPFFDNLILEGWLLGRAEKLFQIDKNNRFALLMLVGRSPIGAVSVVAIDSQGNEIEPLQFPKNQAMKLYSVTELLCDDIGPVKRKVEKEVWGTSRKRQIELLQKSPLETFSVTIYGGAISGAQRKGLFALDKKTGVLAPDVDLAEYIVKPDGSLPELPANEHITMLIAQELSFHTPPFTLIDVDGVGHFFVIRRFDRHKGQKLMQEDMGQLVGKGSSDKYYSSNEKIAHAIDRYVAAAKLAKNDFFRRLAFCFFIANGDMHLKNWSLLEQREQLGHFLLSPCYDLLNTRLVLPHEENDIALTLRGKKKKLQLSYFRHFALHDLKLEEGYVDSVFEELPHWWKITQRAVPQSFLSEESKERYLEIVESRYELLRRGVTP